MPCFDLTRAPVTTAARAAATGLVSMSTRPDPEGSGTVDRRQHAGTHLAQKQSPQYQTIGKLWLFKNIMKKERLDMIGRWLAWLGVNAAI